MDRTVSEFELVVLQKEICNVLTEISKGDFDAMEVLREGLS